MLIELEFLNVSVRFSLKGSSVFHPYRTALHDVIQQSLGQFSLPPISDGSAWCYTTIISSSSPSRLHDQNQQLGLPPISDGSAWCYTTIISSLAPPISDGSAWCYTTIIRAAQPATHIGRLCMVLYNNH
ncbi:hypothetical protein J6590_043949 [Homalodisca vitripennis]|nr:hypothetical protein J6590_043949 [Homalodisca vitripennis]